MADTASLTNQTIGIEVFIEIGGLCPKLNFDEDVVSNIFCGSLLERFEKDHLTVYINSESSKNFEVRKAAYEQFYDESTSTASKCIRNQFQHGSSVFANTCLRLYAKISNLIEALAPVRESFPDIGVLYGRTQPLTETEYKCILSIASVLNASEMAVNVIVSRLYGRRGSRAISDQLRDIGIPYSSDDRSAPIALRLMVSRSELNRSLINLAYIRYDLKLFEKTYLSSYDSKRYFRMAEIIERTYQNFYNDPKNQQSELVRQGFKQNALIFASTYINLYEKISDTIHEMSGVWRRDFSLEEMVSLREKISSQTDEEKACLMVIKKII